MAFKPILFSTPMVKAILDGSKTQTRRIIKEQPVFNKESGYIYYKGFSFDIHKGPEVLIQFAKAHINDVFWVRETQAKMYKTHTELTGNDKEDMGFWYRADGEIKDAPFQIDKWKPSIFMPKEACRIFLKCTNVRVERLHEITEEDSKAEGVKTAECNSFQECIACNNVCQEKGKYWNYMNPSGESEFPCENAKESFLTLWESINGKESLESNPWNFAYDFEVIEKPENFI